MVALFMRCDLDTDGIAVGTLAANGGTLRDAATNNANLTLNSVGATTSVLVDAVAPTVTSVSVPANATYVAGQNLDFTVNFSENVTVVTTGGTPQLAITIGATTRQAVYTSGSGTGALLFRYTVQASDLDTDGITVGTLAANGGTLKDRATNDANLTLNSVGATTSVLVDAVVPTVASVSVPANATYVASQNLDFTVNFSENVTVITTGGTPQLAITIGSTTRQAVYTSGSGTGALLFRYTVQASDLDTDGIAVGTLAANGGTLRDAATNNANLTLNSVGATTSVLVDAVAPTVTSVSVPANATYVAGQNLDFTVNFSENVTVVTTGGTPQLAITIGATTRQAVYTSGSGTGALLFRYTVQASDLDTDGITVGTLAANGGTLKDRATNDANLTLNSVGATTSVLVDAVVPTITSVTSTKGDGSYGLGESIAVTVTFDEAVTVTGTPQLELETGVVDRKVDYSSGSGTSALTFTYTVQMGDESADLDYKATNALTLNGGTIKDAAGNDATLTLVSPGAPNSLGNNKALVVEAFPTVTLTVGSATIVEASGTSTVTATLSAISSQDVTVTLAYSGTATSGTDYNNTASTSITITAGNLSANATVGITATQDVSPELNETIIIDITSVTKGTENGTQQQTITITDDDTPNVSFASTSSSGLESVANANLRVNLSAAGSAGDSGLYSNRNSCGRWNRLYFSQWNIEL